MTIRRPTCTLTVTRRKSAAFPGAKCVRVGETSHRRTSFALAKRGGRGGTLAGWAGGHAASRSTALRRGRSELSSGRRRHRQGALGRIVRTAHRPSHAGTTPDRPPPALRPDRPVNGVCTSPAPSLRISFIPAGQTGRGTRDFPAGPDAMYPPRKDGRDAPGGAPQRGGGEVHRRVRGEAAVVVEQGRHIQPRSGGHLGHDVVGDTHLDRAGAAAVDDLQRSGHASHRSHDGTAAARACPAPRPFSFAAPRSGYRADRRSAPRRSSRRRRRIRARWPRAASAAACSGVRSGERRTPRCSGPTRSDASTSRQIRGRSD